jgi:hypothetical protein
MNRYAAALALGTLVAALSAASCKGCQKEEEVPPMPSATVTPTVEPPLVLVEEDAGDDADADDGDADAAKVGPQISTLVACCRALAQNAKSNPNPMVAGSMMQAAALCESYAKSGNASGVNSALAPFGKSCR